MPMAPAGDQIVEVGERFLTVGIDRAELDALSLERRDAAASQNLNSKIQRQRARMKQIQRPEVNGASGEVGATRSLRGYRGLQGRRGLSRHPKFVSRPDRFTNGTPGVRPGNHNSGHFLHPCSPRCANSSYQTMPSGIPEPLGWERL